MTSRVHQRFLTGRRHLPDMESQAQLRGPRVPPPGYQSVCDCETCSHRRCMRARRRRARAAASRQARRAGTAAANRNAAASPQQRGEAPRIEKCLRASAAPAAPRTTIRTPTRPNASAHVKLRAAGERLKAATHNLVQPILVVDVMQRPVLKTHVWVQFVAQLRAVNVGPHGQPGTRAMLWRGHGWPKFEIVPLCARLKPNRKRLCN